MEFNILDDIKSDVRELRTKIDEIHFSVVKTKTNNVWIKSILLGVVGWCIFLTKFIFNIKIF